MLSRFLVSTDLQSEIRAFLQLAIPLASAQVVQTAISFVDTVMMGWLGPQILAAGGLGALTFSSLLVVSTGLVTGLNPLAAEAYGWDRLDRVGRILIQGLWLAALLTLPGVVILTGSRDLLVSLGQDPAVVSITEEYLQILRWGLLPALGFVVLRGIAATLNLARPIMGIVIMATTFNGVANYVLGFGVGGIEGMGLQGLAWASMVTHWGMFCGLGVYLLCQKRFRSCGLRPAGLRLDPPLLRELLCLGWPIGVASGLEMGLFTVTTLLMGVLGTSILAAHQIVFQTIIVIFMVPLGMSYAATIRVGQWIGRQDLWAARRAGLISVSVAAMFMTGVSTLMLIFPRQVVGLYLDITDPLNQEVISVALPMLRIAALAQILDGVQKNANGSLQGLKDTRIPMILSGTAFGGVGLTSGYLMGFGLDLKGVGLWSGQSIGVAVAAGLFLWRFLKLTQGDGISTSGGGRRCPCE